MVNKFSIQFNEASVIAESGFIVEHNWNEKSSGNRDILCLYGSSFVNRYA